MNMLEVVAIATTGGNPLPGMGGAAVSPGSRLCDEQMAIFFLRWQQNLPTKITKSRALVFLFPKLKVFFTVTKLKGCWAAFVLFDFFLAISIDLMRIEEKRCKSLLLLPKYMVHGPDISLQLKHS
jgi:hypothetical protein